MAARRADERKQGGTLVIRVTPGRGLDLQHETPRIIDRINAFYGYARHRPGQDQAGRAQPEKGPIPGPARRSAPRRPKPSKPSSRKLPTPSSRRPSSGWAKGC